MTRAVVTGGAGFLGSHLCEALLARGDEVVCLDNFLTGSPANVAHLTPNPRFRLVRSDVTDYLHVGGPVDIVLHFASPGVAGRLPEAAHRDDEGRLDRHPARPGAGPRQGRPVHPRLHLRGVRRPQVHPQPETYWGNVNPVGPRGVYDEAKRFAEAMTTGLPRRRTASTPASSASSTPSGRGCGPTTAAPSRTSSVRRCAASRSRWPVTARQTRSICYVDDLVAGILALVAQRPPRARSTSATRTSCRCSTWRRGSIELAGSVVEHRAHRAPRRRPRRCAVPTPRSPRRRWAGHPRWRSRTGCCAPSSGSAGTPSSSEPRAPDGAAQAEDGAGSLRLPSEPPSSPASSTVSGWAMLSSDWPSALTPRNAATMPPATMSAAPMK